MEHSLEGVKPRKVKYKADEEEFINKESLSDSEFNILLVLI